MANNTFLNLTIYPNRSLSKTGFKVLMIIVSFICITCGMVFYFMGAWPVFGFLGLDIVLIYFAFKINYRSGKIYENIRIASKIFTVSRIFPSGKMQVWKLNPSWAKVEFIESRNQSRLLVSSEKKVVSIGSFLNAFDKKKLARKIQNSIKTYKASETN